MEPRGRRGNSYRGTLYTLQASGLEAPAASDVDGVRTSAATEFLGRMNDQDPLFFMADLCDELASATSYVTTRVRLPEG